MVLLIDFLASSEIIDIINITIRRVIVSYNNNDNVVISSKNFHHKK